IDPGEVAGETCVFDDGPPPLEAIAMTDAELLAVDRDDFFDLVFAGESAGHKALAYLARALVFQLRLSNFRLREVVAASRGEVERAARAREQAIEAAVTDRVMTSDAAAGLVETNEPAESCAACLATVLRRMRR